METKDKIVKKKISVEELKIHQNGLDIWRNIEERATTGYDSIPDEEIEFFKWYGVYQQKPNVGHFMVRIRIPGGQMNSNQAREIAQLSRDYGRGLLDVTVRQGIQLHWLTIENIPKLSRRLHAVGLSTTMACGDVPRNVVSCPMRDRDKNHFMDAYPLVQEVNRAVMGNREYANLPRKFKIGISSCSIHCSLPEIQDVGLYGVIRKTGKQKEKGFNLLAGGGLSSQPQFAANINAFVPTDKVVPVCLKITEIFRDMGYRKSRKRARLKFLIKDIGAEAFREELVKRLGYDLDPEVETELPCSPFRDHLGIIPQKKKKTYTLGFLSPAGRITPEDLFVLADIAEQFGSGELANSPMQNILVFDIPESKLEAARDMALNAPTMKLENNEIQASVMPCTGSEFCNLAITETKNKAFEIINHLENTVKLDQPIKIGISGCPNSCSHYHISDIGLRGGRARVNDESVESFDIFAGATLGDNGKFAQLLEKAAPAETIEFKLEKILQDYMQNREASESFNHYINRIMASSYNI
jgi:sulfite reductase beta subunit-like hemoprotein